MSRRGRQVMIAIAALAALAVVPIAAHSAVAGLQDDRFASAPESEFPQRLDRLAATGARVTRVDVLWSDIAPTKPANDNDPNDPAYQFRRLDQILAGLTARGIVPILTIYSAPTWATGGKGPLRDPAPINAVRQYNAWMPNPGMFGRFVGAVVRRYNGGFVNAAYAVQPRARHIEIWNEGNISRYFTPQFDAKGRSLAPKNYMRLVAAAYSRAKAANPRSVIIIGAGGPKSTTRKRGGRDVPGHGTLDWIRAIARNKRMAKFDAFSQHIYPAQPPRSPRVVIPNWASIPVMLREIDRVRRGLRLYITEAGYTTKRTPIRTTAVTEAQQARYLREIFNLRSVRSARIPTVIWFNLQDNQLWPGGLYRENLTPKPSLAAFKAVAGRGAIQPQLRP